MVGGSSLSNNLYITSDPAAVPQRIVKVNLETGQREPFVTVFPIDNAGIVGLSLPIFTSDEKRYVYAQVRELSVLYIGIGLK